MDGGPSSPEKKWCVYCRLSPCLTNRTTQAEESRDGGSRTQNFVQQKWPTSIPQINLMLMLMQNLGPRERGPSEGLTPPFPRQVVSRYNASLEPPVKVVRIPSATP